VHRTLVSTDGAVSVYEEAVAGEGIEGFWWEYDPQADLVRLLDDNRRDERLVPLVDPFGFELAIPDSIVALRDSVVAVADSILAERIQIAVAFSPKMTSSYDETKDRYSLKNSFETSYPFTKRGTANVNVQNNNDFNRSTGKIQDGRRVGSTFNYQFTEGLISTFSLDWTDDLQERDGVRESKSDNISLSGQVRDTRPVPLAGQLETSVGVSYAQRDYRTQTTTGESGQLSPNWKAKLSRAYDGGTASIDYTGNVGTSRRTESRTVTSTDSLGNPVSEVMENESDETNFNNTTNVAAGYNFGPEADLKFTGSISRDQFQYLSQVDSLQGRQETRSRNAESANLVLNSKPSEDLDIKATADYRSSETGYRLEDIKTTRTTTRLASTDITYTAWEGGRWIFKMERSAERRDYRTAQAGDVIKQEASADFKQDITKNVGFEAAYFISLDRYEFDDKETNTGDRDLRTQRGTFTVRYNPFTAVTSSVRMEVRQTESVNINRLKSGDNSTDYAYLISPTYTWRLGKANFSGDFTADARYKVQDYKDDNNTLNRRFAFRQKWQHAFTGRLSTEMQFRWEFNDQGSYNPSPEDGRRRYGRSREVRRSTLESKILYTVVPGIQTRVEYRRDEDDQYRIDGDDKTLTSELPIRQFVYAVDFRREILQHVRLDVAFSQTFKDGPRVSELEKSFYNIRAQMVYEPFRKSEKKKKKNNNGNNP